MKHFMIIALLASLFTNMAIAGEASTGEVDTECPFISQIQGKKNIRSIVKTEKPASESTGSGQ